MSSRMILAFVIPKKKKKVYISLKQLLMTMFYIKAGRSISDKPQVPVAKVKSCKLFGLLSTSVK